MWDIHVHVPWKDKGLTEYVHGLSNSHFFLSHGFTPVTSHFVVLPYLVIHTGQQAALTIFLASLHL